MSNEKQKQFYEKAVYEGSAEKIQKTFVLSDVQLPAKIVFINQKRKTKSL